MKLGVKRRWQEASVAKHLRQGGPILRLAHSIGVVVRAAFVR